MCSSLLADLVKSLLAECLARKTPLRKPNRGGKVIVSIKPRPKRAYDESWFIVLFHLFCMICLPCPPALCDIFDNPMAWYSLFAASTIEHQLTN